MNTVSESVAYPAGAYGSYSVTTGSSFGNCALAQYCSYSKLPPEFPQKAYAKY